jgi:hypothetical protein
METLHQRLADVDLLATRFEAEWRAGGRPRLEDFLPPAGPLRPAVLRELAAVELELRLKSGEPARAEEYIERFRELAVEPDRCAELIYVEYDLRKRHEPNLTLAAVAERFPHLRDELQRLADSASTVRPPAGAFQGAETRAGAARCDEGHASEDGAAGEAASLSIGRFELLKEVGCGSFGRVYQARDT